MRPETPQKQNNPAHAQVREQYARGDELRRRKIREYGYDPDAKGINNFHEQDGRSRPRR